MTTMIFGMSSAALGGLFLASACGTPSSTPQASPLQDVFVPGGSFRAGARCGTYEPEPACDRAFFQGRRTMSLEPFYADRDLVTRDQYAACVTAGACADEKTVPRGRDPLKSARVRFGSARDYCRWRGERLPTHAQFERIARGTDGRIAPWGDAASPCRDSEPSLACLTYEGPAGARSVAFNPQWVDDGLIRGGGAFAFEFQPSADAAAFRCIRSQ